MSDNKSTAAGSSYWQNRPDSGIAPLTVSSLQGAASADAVIIGAGVGGLAAALKLRAAGASVIVLEAARIGDGATANGTGLVAPALRHWNPAALRQLSPSDRQRLEERLAASAGAVRRFIDKHGLHVGVEPTALSALFDEAGDAASAKMDIESWSRTGLSAATLVKQTIGVKQNVRVAEWSGASLLDPVSLTVQLARKCIEMGVRLHSGTPVLGYGRGGLRWVVTAPDGRLDARAMIVATNASAPLYSDRILPDVLSSVVVTETWYVATRQLPLDLRSRIMPLGRSIADPAGLLRTVVWTADGSLLLALRPGLRRGPARARALAIAAFASLFGEDLSREVDRNVQAVWSAPAAVTRHRVAQFHAIGPDAYTWIGGDPDDIALSVLAGTEFADAVLAGSASDLALPLTEPKPIPYRRLRTLVGLPLLPKTAN